MLRASWLLLILAGVGCARGPNVGSELPLRRVVVYRNGVGYFERSGRVNEEEVRFAMRQRLVGDFLASLAVIERGGSSVRSASFPLELEDTENDPEPPEAPEPTSGNTPVPAPKKPKKPDPNAMRDVVLHLDGKEHDLLIGYLSETPVWRPSYRVVLSERGGADLQAWGIVQNLSGEDWNNVTLSLVAGAPLAFQSTLGTPVIPDRPVVTDEGEVIAAVPTGVTSLDQAQPGADVDRYGPEEGYAPAPEAAPADAPAEEKDEEAERSVASVRRRGGAAPAAKPKPFASADKKASLEASSAPGLPGAPAAPPPPPRLSPPRKLSDLAAVALEVGTTRYDLPYPITVPNQSATMVLLANQRVPGEAVLLYAPEPGVPDSQAHPFRVARFTNATPGLLERGPIAVFEKGSFLGQGMLDPLPPRATATVPFALERSVALSRDSRQDEQGARLYRIEAGQLFIERDQVIRSTYRVDNGTDRQAKLLVKHARMPGTRMFKPPPGTEDNAASGVALVPTEVRPHGKTELTIDERRAEPESVDWLSPLANDAVRGYLADSRANPELAGRLREVWTLRDSLRKTMDELEKLASEQQELERLADETRRNLRAIEKNKDAADLRQKLTKRLTDSSARLEAITKRSIELQMASNEQQIRFRDAIRDLKLATPLPPLP